MILTIEIFFFTNEIFLQSEWSAPNECFKNCSSFSRFNRKVRNYNPLKSWGWSLTICRAKSLPWLPKANLTFVQISRDTYQIRAFRINHKKALLIPNRTTTVGLKSAKKWNLCSKSKMSTFVYYCAKKWHFIL